MADEVQRRHRCCGCHRR